MSNQSYLSPMDKRNLISQKPEYKDSLSNLLTSPTEDKTIKTVRP